MGLFGRSYSEAGPGIAKNAPKKKPFFLFWEIYFRKFWKLIGLNFITVLFCIPVVTIGPAIAGMTKVLRQYTLEKNSFVFHDFWKGFSNNIKQSLPLGLLDILFIVSSVCAVFVYPPMGDADPEHKWLFYGLCAISLSVAFIFLMMNFYAYPMIVATELSFGNIIKNSFFLTAVALKKNIVTLLCVALTVGLLVFTLLLGHIFIFAFLLILWAPAFIGFIAMFNSYPAIQKYVINPYYEERGMDNPEYDYLKPLSEDDSVFVDKGGEEKPMEAESKGTRREKDSKKTRRKKSGGKIIS